MKLYTSEVSQFGKELFIANEIVKFDKIGCAEVEDEVAEKLISYSNWYTKEKMKLIEPIKAKSVDEKIDDSWKERYRLEIEKLKKQDEARVNKIKSFKQEVEDVRKDMQVVVDERDELKKQFESYSEMWGKEKEKLEYKCQLSILDVEELKDTATKLSLDTKGCELKVKKGQEPKFDKNLLIELILNSAE